MSTLAIGTDALAFTLPGVDGKDHSLSQYSDKDAVAVIFTCNHCPYAQAWEDRFIAIQNEYGSKGVQLIAINANEAEKYPADNFDAMKSRAADQGFNFPYLHDATQEIARGYGAERTPEVFLFDKSGTLQYHGTVDDNHEDPDAVQNAYLRDAIEAVLSGNAPATASTDPVGCTIKWK